MVRIIVRIMRKNYMELWNYETMGVIELQSYRVIELQNYRTIELQNYRTIEPQNYRTIELQNYRTIEDIIKELWRVRSIGVQELLKNC